ncbi:unnamed protein product, partial [Prorocentrum cordatum]
GIRDTLATHWRGAGLNGLAALMANVSLPTFTDWRWKKLKECLDGLNGFIWSVRGHFDRQALGDVRDRVRVDQVLGALASPSFEYEFELIHWFASWMGRLMAFAGYCPCHPEKWNTGEKFSCERTGCVLGLAFDYSMAALRAGVAEANSWSADRFGPYPHLARDGQGMARATLALGALKVKFLDDLPYLIGRLGQPGIKDKCLILYNRHPPEHHDSTTLAVLQPGTALRAAVDAMGSDGSNMSPSLQREVDSIMFAPLDDTIAEGPHALSRHQYLRARRATFPWIASSMRLDDNLIDVHDYATAIGANLDAQWDGATAILRPPGRISRSHSAVKDGGDDDAGGGDPGGGDGPTGDRHPGGGPPPAAKKAPAEGFAPGEGSLLADYLSRTLVPHRYYSVQVDVDYDDPDDNRGKLFFQVLSLKAQAKVIKTVSMEQPSHETFVVHVQLLEPMNDPIGDVVTAYCIEDPMGLDLFVYLDASRESRQRLSIWEIRDSDIDDCVALHSAAVAKPSGEKFSWPVLALIDELDDNGWRRELAPIEYKDVASSSQYDGRAVRVGRRHYYLCVLCLGTLFEKGAAPFKSTEPDAFYQLLIKYPSKAVAGRTAKEIKAILNGLEDDGALTHATVDRPSKKLKPAAAPALSDEVVGDDGADPIEDIVDGGVDADPPPVHGAADDDDVAGDCGEEVGGDGGPTGDEPPPVADAPAPPPAPLGGAPAGPAIGVPHFIDGQRVTHESHVMPSGARHEGLRVRCSNPGHGACRCFRSTRVDVEKYGPRAAEYFLGAWLRLAHGAATKAAHRKPRREEIDAYALDHP